MIYIIDINEYRDKEFWCLFKDKTTDKYCSGYTRLFIQDLTDDKSFFIASNSDRMLYLVPVQEVFETREICEKRISALNQPDPIYFRTDCGMTMAGIISEEDWRYGEYYIIWVYLKDKGMTKLEVKAR